MADEWRKESMASTRVYRCPQCDRLFESGQFWIQCDACKKWFHGQCVDVEEFEANEIDRFHCSPCEVLFGPSVLRPPVNNHRHDRFETGAESKPTQSGTPLFIQQLLSRQLPSGEEAIVRMRGQQLSFPSLLKSGFTRPILIEAKEGLDLVVPDESFTEKDVVKKLGDDYEIDIIDTRKQIIVKMRLARFVRLMQQKVKERRNIYNCISLEVSKTPLAEAITAPSVVNKISWVHNCWPHSDLKPDVSKYCLLSMVGSYTDFHIDFGGTSVWYHILKGEKVFYLIEPSDENLKLYEDWMKDDEQDEFFGDRVKKCYSLTLRKGHTMLIPTGWIHAVYTSRDSIVFGGNFLHSLNISLQLKIHDMELRMKTPDKYKFPFFELTHWYAAPFVLKLMQDNLREKVPPKFLINGVKSLILALKDWWQKYKEPGENSEVNLYAPASDINCEKLLNDLCKVWRKADKLSEGVRLTKKRKCYKNFEFKPNGIRSALISPINPNIEQSNEARVNISISNQNDVESELTIVEKSLKQEKQSSIEKMSECESKGQIKVKLSFCGKDGSKEVTEKTLAPVAVSPVSKIDGVSERDTFRRKGSAQKRLLGKCLKLRKMS